MNAAEVIEQIERLPEEEKVKVVDFVRHLPNAETTAAMEESIDGLPRFRGMSEVRNAIKDLVRNA